MDTDDSVQMRELDENTKVVDAIPDAKPDAPPLTADQAIAEQEELAELSEEENNLNFATNIRKRIVDETFKDGKLPIDKLEASMLMDSLAGIERTAVARLRIKSDKEKAKAAGGLAVELAKFATAHVSNLAAAATGMRDVIPEPDSALLDQLDVPDHILTDNNNDVTYQDFKKEHDM